MVKIFLFIFAIIPSHPEYHADRRKWLWMFAAYLNHINSKERIIIKKKLNTGYMVYEAVKMSEPVGEGG